MSSSSSSSVSPNSPRGVHTASQVDLAAQSRTLLDILELDILKKAIELKKAHEEIAELRRKIAAKEDSQRCTVVRKNKDDEEEEWNHVMMEDATSEKEEEVRQPVSKDSKVKMNPSKSPNRRYGVLEHTEDNEEDSRFLRRSKAKAARRTPSIRVQETEDDSTDEDARSVMRSKTNIAPRIPSIRVEETEDEEDIPPSQRKDPKVKKSSKAKTETEDEPTSEEEDNGPPLSRKNSKANHKSQGSSGTPLREVDNLMSHIHGMGIGIGSPYKSRPNSRPIYTPMGTYGYGVGVPGTIINSGVGNVTNTTISNTLLVIVAGDETLEAE